MPTSEDGDMYLSSRRVKPFRLSVQILSVPWTRSTLFKAFVSEVFPVAPIFIYEHLIDLSRQKITILENASSCMCCVWLMSNVAQRHSKHTLSKFGITSVYNSGTWFCSTHLSFGERNLSQLQLHRRSTKKEGFRNKY